MGFFDRIADMEEALGVVDHHRLLSPREMARLFPDSRIVHERPAGAVKSIMAASP